LLTYSIALCGQTWYEKVVNAYIHPKGKYEKYRNQVKIYMDKKTKSDTSFDFLYNTVMFKNHSTRNIITKNYEVYNTLFKESKTFPEFFIKLNKMILREDNVDFLKHGYMILLLHRL
jgi:hypothetical protein